MSLLAGNLVLDGQRLLGRIQWRTDREVKSRVAGRSTLDNNHAIRGLREGTATVVEGLVGPGVHRTCLTSIERHFATGPKEVEERKKDW